MKKICIFEPSFNTLITPWIKDTFTQIERFVKFEGNEYERVTAAELDKCDEVFLVGYKTSQMVDVVIDLNKKGIKANIIENLCCDENVSNHRKALDKLFAEGIRKIRFMRYLQNDIQKFIKETIERVDGETCNIKNDDIISTLDYDSIVILNLSLEIEHEYNTIVSPIAFTKHYRVDEFYKILENGQIGNKFVKK